MLTRQINIRDPFVLPLKGQYYMYGTRGADTWSEGTGFDVYVSEDLVNWQEPIEVFKQSDDFWADLNYWAPEVHFYKDRFFMLASFKTEGRCRGTQILVAEEPTGPFKEHSDGPITPIDWECLDGTLYVDSSGTPYMVFCHEWVQIRVGTICAVQLSDDLRVSIGEPIVLFEGNEPSWASKKKGDRAVTDGPFMYRADNGELLMIWSAVPGSYVQAVSRSDNGDILGNWSHDDDLLFERDGGHGMIFETFEGRKMLTLHQPNKTPEERPVFFELEETEGRLSVIG